MEDLLDESCGVAVMAIFDCDDYRINEKMEIAGPLSIIAKISTRQNPNAIINPDMYHLI